MGGELDSGNSLTLREKGGVEKSFQEERAPQETTLDTEERKYLIAVDGSSHSLNAVGHAAQYCAPAGTKVNLLHGTQRSVQGERFSNGSSNKQGTKPGQGFCCMDRAMSGTRFSYKYKHLAFFWTRTFGLVEKGGCHA